MKKLTVFTPAFNRAYCINQLYESLLRQTNKEFIWLVVDDGSSDNTRELISKWKDEKKIEIKYIYQENQGMHGAHNTAYSDIDTELNVCIDSDDFMTDNAVELILNKWGTIENKTDVAGIVGLDIDKKGDIIGKKLPDDIEFSTLYDVYHIYKAIGDKKLVLRTEIVKKYPKYPIFKNETFVPLGTLYMMIDQDFTLSYLNEPLCVVEYMADGSTMNIFNQYKKHPKGFRYSRKNKMLYSKGAFNQIKAVLHFISSTIYIKDFKFFEDNPKKLLTLFLLPIGLLFHIYVSFKSK